MTSDLPQTKEQDWKVRVYLLSGLAGLIVGLLAAYFYARVAQENGADKPARIHTMDALKLAVSVLSFLRQITDLGAKGGEK
ncbi:MAG TPA: hypothetical protein VMT24_04555 [Aggregatilineaceae bacterium]|nr:hypothetical protein [Aggregatilineaceae bacterium]